MHLWMKLKAQERKMSKLSFFEKLLNNVNVEHRELGKVGQFLRGKRFVRNDITQEGFPCIHYGEIYTHYGIWAEETKSFIEEKLATKLRVANHGDVVIVAAGETVDDIGNGVAWLGEKDVVIHDACFSYKSTLNPKYVSYFLRTSSFKKQIKKYISTGKISSINEKGLSMAKIPIPSPEIQIEIVRILDEFTELVSEITAELTTELPARKKQYNYYRDQLLTFSDDEAEWKPLEELCHFVSSGRNKKKSAEGNYPVFGSTGIIGRTDEYSYDKKQILVARVGANAGYVHLADGKYDVSDNTIIVNVKENYNLKFLFYILVNMNLRQYAKGAGQPLITSGQLKEFKIPIPWPNDPKKSLEVQARIAATLDEFDVLTNAITERLPHEIELRQKQYEYYRDLLLSFPKSKEEVI